MKKILSALILISFLVPIVIAAVVTTAPETCRLKYDLTAIDAACTKNTSVRIEDYGMCCLLNTIYSATDWIFVVLAAIAALFVIIGGIFIVTAGGSTEQVTKGKNYIMLAVIGLAVAFLAKAIPSIVKMIVGI